MKATYLSLGLLALLASCASSPITLAPVGPAPTGVVSAVPAAGQGELEVFTETEEYDYSKDVPYFPHRDYQLYAPNGKRLKRVWNHQNSQDEIPAVVTLPAGQYVVKADAEFYGPVTVPVVIKPNELTKVILQPGWKPGPTVSTNDLVQFPGGYAVGWRAEPAEQ